MDEDSNKEQSSSEDAIANEIVSITENAGRKLQLALVNALYKQIVIDPTGVSASTLAVAERMLARWNMGLVELPEDSEMTEEEKQMVKQFEELNMGMTSDLFETQH